MGLHALVTEQPEYQEALEQRAEAARVAQRWYEHVAAEEAEHQRALDVHRTATREALRRGDELPPQPVAPLVDSTLGMRLAEERIASRELERDALERLAPVLLPALAGRAATVEATVREVVDLLRPIVAEVNELRESAQRIAAAAAIPWTSADGPLDTVRMFELIADGGRLLPPVVDGADLGGDAAGLDTEAPRGSQRPPGRTGGRGLEGRR